MSFDDRIATFVSNRTKVLEGTVTLRRAAHQVAGNSKAIDYVLAEIARRRREDLRRWLGDELKAQPAWMNAAIETLTSGTAWDALRNEQHLSPAAATQVLSQALHHWLGPTAS